MDCCCHAPWFLDPKNQLVSPDRYSRESRFDQEIVEHNRALGCSVPAGDRRGPKPPELVGQSAAGKTLHDDHQPATAQGGVKQQCRYFSKSSVAHNRHGGYLATSDCSAARSDEVAYVSPYQHFYSVFEGHLGRAKVLSSFSHRMRRRCCESRGRRQNSGTAGIGEAVDGKAASGLLCVFCRRPGVRGP